MKIPIFTLPKNPFPLPFTGHVVPGDSQHVLSRKEKIKLLFKIRVKKENLLFKTLKMTLPRGKVLMRGGKSFPFVADKESESCVMKADRPHEV